MDRDPASAPMRLALVGAGPAGLAAAHALSPDVRVTAFEKSRGVSGRAATRWRDASGRPALAAGDVPFRWRYDHGAQYLGPDPDSAVGRFLRDLLGDDLVEIDGAVWPFDDAGTLHPDEARQDGARWTLPDGIAGLGRRLAEATPDLDLRLETRVARLVREGASWTIETDDGARHGVFDAVLLTPPAPQTAGLLRASDLGPVDGAALADALGGAGYRSQFAVVWAFDVEIDRPADVYALVNRRSAQPTRRVTTPAAGTTWRGWPSRATSRTGRPSAPRSSSPRWRRPGPGPLRRRPR